MDCNSTSAPIESKWQHHRDADGQGIDAMEFRWIIGCLRYLLQTKPDLSYATGIVSRYMECPIRIHLKAVKRILMYVNGIINHRLMHNGGNGAIEITGYTDSDLAGDTDDRRTTSGMVLCLNNSLVT
ncbi:uncharacterized mitochondrial protein AtMg00810-like [Oryza brachyantha]|uniref:uncharacterized mitochondrial protein AtMg00810-like n=1 Tax=Oryza brachyantha TaxID=4533 RepID=UPI000776AC49|nr:uncharacterized mitochondrial protein AtMg00810-like [Oryza brachyantha]